MTQHLEKELQHVQDSIIRLEGSLASVMGLLNMLHDKLVLEPVAKQNAALEAHNLEFERQQKIADILESADDRFPGLGTVLRSSFIDYNLAVATLDTSDPLAIFHYLYMGAGKDRLRAVTAMTGKALKAELDTIDRRIRAVKAITANAMQAASTGAQDGAQRQGPESK